MIFYTCQRSQAKSVSSPRTANAGADPAASAGRSGRTRTQASRAIPPRDTRRTYHPRPVWVCFLQANGEPAIRHRVVAAGCGSSERILSQEHVMRTAKMLTLSGLMTVAILLCGCASPTAPKQTGPLTAADVVIYKDKPGK